jgi:hypothetical protein
MITMSATVLRPHLVCRVVAVLMLSVAPRAMDEEQTIVDDTASEDGILRLVHIYNMCFSTHSTLQTLQTFLPLFKPIRGLYPSVSLPFRIRYVPPARLSSVF